ncbi:dsDNA nuclease domain-containing protein [Shewanella sp. MR-4]|uniref:dsDNA nuclease domain-containing protein n=1 Tax=Shewanella sp. (strain MR-4) TaxID=60480 RepID=UPI0002E2E4AB|nr:dsDNA nuclease domain-containing protein [Shewanella sp. MR-4]
MNTMTQSDGGGVAALKGFTYQNLAAAYYVLNMLQDKSLLSVRCEVIDDIDLIYADKIEYIQVKTTDSDTKWCIKEFAEASIKTVPPTGRQRVNQNISLEDSILHKSIKCDKEKLPSFFRILTSRDVTDALRYLKISIIDRNEKTQEREPLLKRLDTAINRNRKKLPPYTSPNGNDTEYWLDHAEWTVIPNREHLELLCTKLILQSAQQKGIYLSANGDPERILASLLKNVTDKGAASRILKTIANKSYHRTDFIPWFNAEVEYYAGLSRNHVKVYTTSRKELTAILSSFFHDRDIYNLTGEKLCTGLQGQYHQRKYSYNLLAKNLHLWLPEVLLHPTEIADNAPENLVNKFSTFTQRYNTNITFIKNLISKALLHSIIRTQYKSQPIAAELHIDDSKRTCFDNIHIVLEDHAPDKLLMGFSELIFNDINKSLSEIVKKFHNLIDSDAFSTQKDKILTAKDDSYLLEHDIDEILSKNKSLDDFLDRIRFIFFIGYESVHLKCNMKEMEKTYLEELTTEVIDRFKSLIDELILENEFCEELHIEVFLYPIPSMSSLISAVQKQGDQNGH